MANSGRYINVVTYRLIAQRPNIHQQDFRPKLNKYIYYTIRNDNCRVEVLKQLTKTDKFNKALESYNVLLKHPRYHLYNNILSLDANYTKL